MFYPSVNERGKVRKAAFLAIIFTGILLSINAAMFISVLGTCFATNSLFPLLDTLRMIKVGFLERMDILIVIIMTIGGFFKISLYMYASMLGTAHVIRLKDPKYLAVPFGIGIIILSVLIAKNYPENIEIGLKWVPVYIHISLQIIIPILALVVHYIKRIVQKKHRSMSLYKNKRLCLYNVCGYSKNQYCN